MKQHNAGLQLRRTNGIQLKERNYLRNMLSRRQLQGFVRQRRQAQATYELKLTIRGHDPDSVKTLLRILPTQRKQERTTIANEE